MLAFLAALLIVGVWLIGSALLRNGVPISAPPGTLRRISAYLSTNVAETKDDHPFPELRTRYFDVDAESLFARVGAAMDILGWTRFADADARILRAEVRTPLLRFTDDLSAEVIRSGERRAKLRVRSSSRVGRADFGANAGHILRLYDALGRVPASAGKG